MTPLKRKHSDGIVYANFTLTLRHGDYRKTAAASESWGCWLVALLPYQAMTYASKNWSMKATSWDRKWSWHWIRTGLDAFPPCNASSESSIFQAFRMQSAFTLILRDFMAQDLIHTPCKHIFKLFFFPQQNHPRAFHVNSTSSPQLKFLNLHYFFLWRMINMYSDKSQNINVMDVYLLSIHYFVEGGQNYNFHLRFEARLQGGSNKKWKNGSIMMLFLHRNW